MASVTNNSAQNRFEMKLDGGETAFIQYTENGDVLDLTHTEVPPGYEGKGIGKQLVQGTFDLVKAEGKKIVPSCKFVATYVERNPEHKGIVANG